MTVRFYAGKCLAIHQCCCPEESERGKQCLCAYRCRHFCRIRCSDFPAGAFEKSVAGAENCDICLIVGTSGMVYPSAALPSIAKRAGAFVVEINCEETPLSEICDEVIKGKAGEVIPLL